MKKLKLKQNDLVVILTDSGKRKGQKIVYNRTSYDVVKVNKKSVILQTWPTEELFKLKAGK